MVAKWTLAICALSYGRGASDPNYVLELAASMPYTGEASDHSEAGAPADETTISEGMIDAGVSVLAASGIVSPTMADWVVRRVVRDTLEAALRLGGSSVEQ